MLKQQALKTRYYIVRISDTMARYGRLRSFQFIETSTVCDFLLAFNSSLGNIFYRFRDIATKRYYDNIPNLPLLRRFYPPWSNGCSTVK